MNLLTQEYTLNRPHPPPTWLNPQKLGATELREIPRDKIRIIDNGRKGLIEFFTGARPEDVTDWDAFVVNRKDKKGQYVYSNEQFWLAAAAAFKSQQFKLHLNRHVYGWLKDLSFKSRRLQDLLADAGLWRHGRPLDLKRASPKSREALGNFFDLHEYSICDQCQPDQVPELPAVRLDPEDRIEVAYVPDTTHLARGVSRVLTRRMRRIKPLWAGDYLAAPSDKPSPTLVHRFPHMKVQPEPPFAPGAVFEVTILADKTNPKPGEHTDPIKFDAPADVKDFVLTVWLLGTRHFKIDDSLPKSITITRDVDRSTDAVFQVAVRNDIIDPSPPRLTAIFQYKQRPCGSVSLDIDLGNPPVSLQAGVGAGDPKIEIEPPAQPADLIVTVANPTPDGLEYDCIVTTPHLPKFKNGFKDTWRPGGTTQKVVDLYFSFFTAPDLRDDLRVANLTGAGVKLFGVAPDHFKEAFWALLDGDHPLRSISVVTIEPFIPWELMVPKRGKPDGTTEQRQALGTEFAIGRWISSTYRSSRQRITLTNSRVFAPVYTEKRGPTPLAHSAEESELVRKEFSGDEIAPADFSGFEHAMAGGARSLIHFVCHGKSAEAGAQTIYVQDGTTVPSFAFTGGKTTPPAIAKDKPFVFFNACEAGRTTPSLVGVEGFAPTFIDLGASCVIAPLWSVKDEFAHNVAKEFYGAVKSEPGKPFAAILATIRARAYGPDGAEDTYAAYCFYGDPLATQCR
jgi:CHAT domain-containing protein